MTTICPTVTATSLTEFSEQLSLVLTFANRIHIDIMDGDFAPTKSPIITTLPSLPVSEKVVDIHVMYRNPEEISDQLIAIKPNMVIIHAESIVDVPLFAAKLRRNGIKTGLALLPETTVDSVASWLPHVQQLLIFSGNLGYHGGGADVLLLHKINEAKKYHRNLEFSWDGGANLNNVGKLHDAGIDIINVGGAIHAAVDPRAAYAQLAEFVA